MLTVLSQSNQRLYLLELLRSQGLSTVQLDQVSQATIVSWLRYALPAWSGFLTVDLINRIQSTLKRLYRYGYSIPFHSDWGGRSTLPKGLDCNTGPSAILRKFPANTGY